MNASSHSSGLAEVELEHADFAAGFVEHGVKLDASGAG